MEMRAHNPVSERNAVAITVGKMGMRPKVYVLIFPDVFSFYKSHQAKCVGKQK